MALPSEEKRAECGEEMKNNDSIKQQSATISYTETQSKAIGMGWEA